MRYLFLGLGLFVFFIGIIRLIQAIWFRNRYIQKWGQVVGFNEEVKGLYSVVLRFQGLSEKEYFLVDREKSPAPNYAMGEFIPILVSRRSSKHCLLFAAASLNHALAQVAIGAIFLFVYTMIFKISFADILVTTFFGIAIWTVFTLFPESKLLAQIGSFKISHFLSRLREPLILEIEQSKMIKWTNSYAGTFLNEKTRFSFQRELARIFRPLFLLASAVCMVLCVKELVETSRVNADSYRAGAIYDGAVYREVYGMRLLVPVFRYYGPRKQIYASVDTQTPFILNLKKGQKIIAFLPRDKSLPARLDRGWLNYWRSFVSLIFSFLFLNLSGKARRRLEVKKKKSPIYLRRVS